MRESVYASTRQELGQIKERGVEMHKSGFCSCVCPDELTVHGHVSGAGWCGAQHDKCESLSTCFCVSEIPPSRMVLVLSGCSLLVEGR